MLSRVSVARSATDCQRIERKEVRALEGLLGKPTEVGSSAAERLHAAARRRDCHEFRSARHHWLDSLNLSCLSYKKQNDIICRLLEGTRNLQALNDVATWQRLHYDFSFNRLEFETNIRTLVVSEGKSLVKVKDNKYACLHVCAYFRF